MSAHCVAISKYISRCALGGSVFAVSMHLDACSRHVLEVSIGLPLIKGDKAACYGLDRRSRLAIPVGSSHSFETRLIAFLLLLAGNLFKGF